MPSVLDQLRFLRNGGYTLRYHTVHRIEHERVGQHSFGVAWLCYLLTGGHVTGQVLIHALAHDVPEWATGDIPAPTKRTLNIREACEALEGGHMYNAGICLPALTVDEANVVKLADVLDGMLSCTRERALGNKLIEGCYFKFLEYAKELVTPGQSAELLDAVEHLWMEATI